jgi:hypothetical protein
LSKIDDTLDITAGDSVLVIGEDGKLKKLIMPEFRQNLTQSAGTEKVMEILKIFDPEAELETFEQIDKNKLN